MPALPTLASGLYRKFVVDGGRPTRYPSGVVGARRASVPPGQCDGSEGISMGVSTRVRVWLGIAAVATLSAGCGWWGDDVHHGTIDVDAQGRVVLGTIGGATLEVFRVGDYGAPIATTTTSVGGTLPEIGNFSFSVEDVPADALFLLVVTGGSAYDPNEDGVMDAPFPNVGTVHALATAAQLDAGGVNVSVLSEIVYQRVRYFLQSLYDEHYVTRASDSWSSFVIRNDI